MTPPRCPTTSSGASSRSGPRPINWYNRITLDFPALKLHPNVLRAVEEKGFTEPTPIQWRAIPPTLDGRDVLGLAQTGTGKTAAFVLPILTRLIDGPRKRVRAVIVAPTRELAEQIHEDVLDFAKYVHIPSATIYGGVKMRPQIKAIREGAEVIVVCPGRLLDHCQQRTLDLSHVEVLVLDEADRMFDMGFLPDIRRIVQRVPVQRQTLLFSATMPPDIRRLAHEILRDPITVQIDHAVPLSTVSHALYPVMEHLKLDLLVEILRRTGDGSVLVFTRTKARAKRVARRLELERMPSDCIQGDLSQGQRKAAMDGFREGRSRILVATDVAARGIDVSQITHVINFDVPDSADSYTHRIGRTGRAARTGDAFTLMTIHDRGTIEQIERGMGKSIERRLLDGFDYDRRPGEAKRLPQAPPAPGTPPAGLGTVIQPSGAPKRAVSGFRALRRRFKRR